jgi:hypothetical protein
MAKKKVTRLFNLDVDEISSVDQPAIAEKFIVTKSVNGKGNPVSLKVKNAAEQAAEATSQDNAQAAAVATQKAEGDAVVAEGAPAPAADPAAPAPAEPPKAPEAAPAQAEPPKQDEVMKGLEAKIETVSKSMANVNETLAAMLELHTAAAAALNSIVGMTFDAMDMCADMVGSSSVEATKAKLVDARKKCADEKTEIQKAGAKISAERLAKLQGAVDELMKVIGECRAGERKKSEEVITLETTVVELQKSLQASQQEVTKMASRLSELENSPRASSANQDDGDSNSETSSDKTKGKSVFAGILDIEGIKKRAEINRAFLERKTKK